MKSSGGQHDKRKGELQHRARVACASAPYRRWQNCSHHDAAPALSGLIRDQEANLPVVECVGPLAADKLDG